MNTDDLLTTFRSAVPLPDEATAQRNYARATHARQRLSRRMLVFAAATLMIAGGVAGGLATTLGGGSSTARTSTGRGDIPRIDMTVRFAHSNGTLTSVALTLEPEFGDATVQLQVEHSDATTYREAYAELYSGATQVVFQEKGSTADTGSWSATLSPSEWNGGCESGLYHISWLIVGSEESSSDSSDWFRCSSG